MVIGLSQLNKFIHDPKLAVAVVGLGISICLCSCSLIDNEVQGDFNSVDGPLDPNQNSPSTSNKLNFKLSSQNIQEGQNEFKAIGNWKARTKLRFKNASLSEDFVDFPVLVKLNSSRIDYSKVQDDGADLRFYDSNASTALDYEIEVWDESGDSFVWVKVPQINKNSVIDHIYMYYDNVAAIDNQNLAGVWSNGYKGVWHLNQDPSDSSPLAVRDSTINGNHGTVVGAMNSSDSVSGRSGPGINFDGLNDRIDIPYNASFGIKNKLMVSAWIRYDAIPVGVNGILFHGRPLTPNSFTFELTVDSSGDVRWGIDTIETGEKSTYALINTVQNQWQYLVGRYDSTLAESFVNTQPNGARLVDGDLVTSADPIRIAYYYTGSTQYFEGIIDEVRISNVTRSPIWIQAQHLSQADSFLEYGVEEGSFGQSYELEVNLDRSESVDTVVNYSVAGSGTFSVDHNLASGSVTILAGQTQANIDFIVFGDNISEGNENLTVQLTTVSNSVVLGDQATHEITIENNSAPIVVNESYAVAVNSGVSNISVLGNDSDPEGDLLLIESILSASNGVAVIAPGGLSINYTPESNFVGSDTITYSVTDGRSGTTVGQLTISVINATTWTGDASDGLWSNLGNWCGSIVSGACLNDRGTLPQPTDVVIFSDVVCGINCDASIDLIVDVKGLHLLADYTGSLTQLLSQTLTIQASHLIMDGGTFIGSDSLIELNSDLRLNGGVFTSTTGDLRFSSALANFLVTEGVFAPNNGTVRFESYNGCSTTYHRIDFKNALTFDNLFLRMRLPACASQQVGILVIGETSLVVSNSLIVDSGSLAGGAIDFKGNTLDFNCSSPDYCSAYGDLRLMFSQPKNYTYGFQTGAVGPSFVTNNSGFTLSPGNSGNFGLQNIDLQTGTFVAPDGTLTLQGRSFKVDGGTFAHNSGHLVFVKDNTYCATTYIEFITAVPVTLNDFTLSLRDDGCNSTDDISLRLPAASTINVLGNFIFENGGVTGGGLINVEGNVQFDCPGGSTSSSYCVQGGDIRLSMVGGNAQTFTQTSGANIPRGDFTVAKSGNEILFLTNVFFQDNGQATSLINGTINMNNLNWTLQGDLTLNNGTVLNKGAGTLTVIGTLNDLQ